MKTAQSRKRCGHGDAKLWERRLGDDLPNIGVSERAILGGAPERVIGRG